MKQKQYGVALITALLVTAVATIAAVAMASRQQLDIRRSGNVIDVDRSYMFALGVEDWAKQVLIRDRKDNQIDNLEEDWATVLPPLSVEGGTVAGRIIDMQGLFNLNNLINNGAPSPNDRKIFELLLQNAGVSTDIIDAVIDWMDKDDQQIFPNGAEDNDYLSQDIPYRTPNAAIASPSELALIKGMKYEDYAKIAPYVTALPERTMININTAPPQVLMAVIEGITQSEAEQIVDDRANAPFKDINEFMAHTLVQGRPVMQDSIGMESKYFMVTGSTQFDQGQLTLYSLVSRNDKAEVQVIMRAQGVY